MPRKRDFGEAFAQGMSRTLVPTAVQIYMSRLQQLMNTPEPEDIELNREYKRAQIERLRQPTGGDFFEKLALIEARGSQQKERTVLAKEEREEYNTIQPKDAEVYQKAFPYVPPDFWVGKRRSDVPALTSQAKKAQDQIAGMQAAVNSVAQLKKMWDEIQSEVGPVSGRGKYLASRVSGGALGGPAAQKIAAYKDLREGMVTSIRKAFGDSGAPSNFDVERLARTLPDVTEVKKLGEGKWTNVQSMIGSGTRTVVQTFPFAAEVLEYGKTGKAPAAAVKGKPKASGAAALSDEDLLKALQGE